MSSHIILISCSNGKQRGGHFAYNARHAITALLPLEVRRKLLHRRSVIAGRMMSGQVTDRLRGDGNRRDSRYNIELTLGPDLNPDLISDLIPDLVPDLVPDVAPATETTASDSPPFMAYLPAYQRYDGRFFAHVGQNAFEQAILEDCHVLIVSGLYGLLLPEEPIQAYNCHLDDEIIGPIVSDDTASDIHTETDANADVEADAGARIADIWRRNGFSNRLLQAFIQWHDQHHDHRIQQVVDILSETSYQRLFNWDELYSWFKRRRITWFHRLVQGVREPAFLADLGRWFRHEVVEKDFVPPPPGKLVRPYLHTINEAGGRLEFTKDIHPDPFTAGLLQRTLGDVTWHQLDRRTREDLIHGELFFQLYDARSGKQPDETAPRIVNFFSALENELHIICQHKAGKGSLGGFIYHLCEGTLTELWPNDNKRAAVCDELVRLLGIRNKMSHRGVVTREELLEARSRILKRGGVLSELVGLKVIQRR